LAQSFSDFIVEEKTEENYKVVILTVEFGDKSITAKKFEKEAQKMGMETFLANFKEVSLSFNNGKHTLSDNNNSIDVSKDDTVVFVRGTPTRDSMLDLISELERIGISCINTRTTISICADKYRSYVRLKDFKLLQPKTVLIPNEDSIDSALEELDTKFPIILKTLRGSKGVGVLFIESKRALDSIVQLLYKQDKDTDILIQEYIKTDYDVRAVIVGNKIIGTMRRDVIEGDFRSNVSQGAKPKPYKLSEEEVRQCLIAAKAVDGDCVAVDFIPYKGQPYFLEVNSSPGTDGIEDANSGLNIAKEIIQHYKNTESRYSAPTKCGYHEVVSVLPFGEMEGKFDTGNGILSVLHAEDIKINGKKITFTLNGKTITTNLVKMYEATTGGGVDRRPVVELDMEFMGHSYQFMFGLDDRSEMGTDVLLNRFAMTKMNVMVDPQKKFIITTMKGKDNDA
jgi:ribosomal protein S6--L-glutamate ligase